MTISDDDYWKLGSDRMELLLDSVNSIIGGQPKPRRDLLRKMMDSPIGSQFMLAPASTRRLFHNAYPCGLVSHSLTVASNAVKIADALWPGQYDRATLEFCGLLHDLGKAGSPGKPYYVQTKDEWKIKKNERYEVSQDEYMTNPERSVYTLLDNGIKLSYDEFQAIRLNDGMAPPENKPYSFKERNLALIVHWADHAAMVDEKAAQR